jgi:molybdopterin converting factor small subunit
MPTIRVPSMLRALTGQNDEVVVSGATVRDAMAELERKHPGISAKVFDPSGNVKPFIRIYVGPDDIGSLAGLDTQVGERDEIAIIPAIAGGSDAR